MARRLREIPRLAPALAALEAAEFKKSSLPMSQIVTNSGLWNDMKDVIEDLTRPLSDDYETGGVQVEALLPGQPVGRDRQMSRSPATLAAPWCAGCSLEVKDGRIAVDPWSAARMAA